MNTFLDCWVKVAGSLFAQALAGSPELVEAIPKPVAGATIGFRAEIAGEVEGAFSVIVEGSVLDAPLMGEGMDQAEAWRELVRETFDAAAGEMLAVVGKRCRVERFEPAAEAGSVTRAFALKTGEKSWTVLVRDRVREAEQKPKAAEAAATAPPMPAAPRPAATPQPPVGASDPRQPVALSPGLELLLDVELEASLRFGARELPLGEILDLGPGDVVQLDRQVAEPVDLIVADKIVARGDVVLVNGNFGLRITEVAEPRKRLESIRCLF
jgi:flagellar motor switch protein FliN/FliY